MFSSFCQKYKLTMLYGVLLLLTVLFLFINNKYTYYWFDEGFSLSLIKRSYSDIWNLTAADVHPPLYYFMLKAYASVMGSSPLSLRVLSATPILLTVLVSCTLIRRLWGDKVAISFIIIIFLSPLTYYMTSEIRMYSWSMFFVLMTLLCAYVSYVRASKKYLILFILFSLAAGYSHYYALVAVGYVYLLYFIVALLKERKKLVNIIVAGLVFVLGYLPWLLLFVVQLKNVNQDYWIFPIDPVSVFLESVYIFSSLKETKLYDLYIRELEIGVFVSLILFLFVNLLRRGKRKDIVETLLVISVFLFPLLFGIIYSLTIKPILVPRYVNCFVGPFFLGLAMLVSQVDFSKKNKYYLNSVFCLFLFCSEFVGVFS